MIKEISCAKIKNVQKLNSESDQTQPPLPLVFQRVYPPMVGFGNIRTLKTYLCPHNKRIHNGQDTYTLTSQRQDTRLGA